jgi:hypothetical protein
LTALSCCRRLYSAWYWKLLSLPPQVLTAYSVCRVRVTDVEDLLVEVNVKLGAVLEPPGPGSGWLDWHAWKVGFKGAVAEDGAEGS